MAPSIKSKLRHIKQRLDKLQREASAATPRFDRFLAESVRNLGEPQGLVADAIGVSRFCLYSWEIGRTVPRDSALPHLARVLRVDEEVLRAVVVAERERRRQ